ncbi:endoglucanase 6 [Selaginella moellendorffii]|uniref:endoglucanase 6 n=1 Tax=Selaginella moellendorffii TaxID=88036 RepID=UPI000D1C7C6D|nr:endoglucanase 6 [Selaginella moellendorffii]|eukprot:XP_024536388.1 endoglucanase 6 [Selaginella moellendorffii]
MGKKNARSLTCIASLACIFISLSGRSASAAAFDYGEALSKSILFYEAQRSGRLPDHQRVTWRSHSGLEDGKASGVDLSGGYYDAGDNVKFGLPMAFTITMLSWSVVEYRDQIAKSGELGNTLGAIKWGTDYFLKSHTEPNVLWGQVGEGQSDHACWQRPEDMTTSRQAYRLDPSRPGSDLAGETAAAMAAASMAFRGSQASYSNLLLTHAKQLFNFADTYRGKYDSSIPVAQKFYSSRSGYADELLWAAIWLHRATGEQKYLDYVAKNAAVLGGTGWSITEFSWDIKYAGVQVLASKVLLDGKAGSYKSVLEQYQSKAEYFLCACLQQNSGAQVQRTPGGLMFIRQWNNMQYVTSASFLLTVYSDYLTSTGNTLRCNGRAVNPSQLLNLARSQVDYILGDNPRATSYLVGFGFNYPRQVHHRAASIVSIKQNPSFVGCKEGYSTWYTRRQSDPNLLVGALVGGPDVSDNFADERNNWEQTEPTTYNNGPLVGLLARLHNGGSTRKNDQNLVSLSKAASPLPSPSSRKQPGDGISIDQNVTMSWDYRGQRFYRYGVTVSNRSKQTLEKLVLKIHKLSGSFWGLTKLSASDHAYTFPSWIRSLPPRSSFTFVYVQPAPLAEISVQSFARAS